MIKGQKKISEEKQEEIFAFYLANPNLTQKELSLKFGYSRQTIDRIINKKFNKKLWKI